MKDIYYLILALLVAFILMAIIYLILTGSELKDTKSLQKNQQSTFIFK